MMKQIIKVMFPFLCVLALAGCTSSTQFTPLTPDFTNLIYNSGFYLFNSNGQERYWVPTDTSLVKMYPYYLMPDTAAGDPGFDNVGIKRGIAPMIGAMYATAVPPAAEAVPFKLQLWAAAMNDTGSFYVDIYRSSGVTRMNGTPIISPQWTEYEMIDSTYMADQADSIHVGISAGSSDSTTNGMIIVNYCVLFWPIPPPGFNN